MPLSLIRRRHDAGSCRSEALYSPCESYRYLLRRDWGHGPHLLYILLNPSTATEERNDPTLERCERRARALGFGGFAVANIFAFRATDPALLRTAQDPIGPGNDTIMAEASAVAGMVLCGWGHHGAYAGRGSVARQMLHTADATLWCLGLTRAGHPRHPLYLSYRTAPRLWAQ